MKVLIVEDEMIISEDVREMLESQNYQVTDQAMTYDEAIESMISNRPDLALLDINLRNSRDGIEIAKWINEQARIPFIYTSSLGDSSTILRAKETHPSAYLVKPFKDEQLFASIEVAFTNYAKLSEAEATDKTGEKLPIFNDSIFVKQEHRFVKVPLNDIKYVCKSDNYLEIFTIDNRYIIRTTLSHFLDQIGSNRLFKTHKSYAINPSFITDLSPTMITLQDIDIPISKNYLDSLKSLMNIF